jgi:hypothetical protein
LASTRFRRAKAELWEGFKLGDLGALTAELTRRA